MENKIYLLMRFFENDGCYESYESSTEIVSVHKTKEGALAKMFSDDILGEDEFEWNGKTEILKNFWILDQEKLGKPEERDIFGGYPDYPSYHKKFYIVEEEVEP